jgi:hypothetical protein
LVGACLTIAVGFIAFAQNRENAVAQAGSEARYADYLLRTVHDGVRAKAYLLHAADNWHIAGDTVQEQRARQRADNAYQEAAVAREAAAEEAKRKEDLERRLAQEREFDRQWRINAQKVIDAHPELRYEDSLYSLAMKKILSSNPVYSKYVDGYELAYKAIRKQLPPPSGAFMPTTEFYSLLDNLKTDVAPAVPVAPERNP